MKGLGEGNPERWGLFYNAVLDLKIVKWKIAKQTMEYQSVSDRKCIEGVRGNSSLVIGDD